jgi:hypothetical protein
MAKALAAVGALALAAGTAGLAVDAAGAATPKVDHTTVDSAWGARFAIDQNAAVNGVTAVSCASTTFCMAVDGAGRVLSFTGSGWSKPKSIDADPTGFSGLACRTKTFCIATDTDGFATTWNGRHWSKPHQIDPTSIEGELQLFVSCPVATFCAAADSSGYLLTFHGTSWKRHLAEDRFGNALSFSGISCTSSSFCVAVDNTGGAVTLKGSTWSKVTQTSTDVFDAVSCVSPTFCAAVGDGALTYNGKTWSAEQGISSVQVGSVSCVSPKHCVAGDDLGDEYLWNGRWAAGRSISADDGLNSIACVTTAFCAVVTYNGNAVFYDVEPYISATSLPNATVGKEYSGSLKIIGGVSPYRARAVKGLPKGLTVSASGALAGKPTAAGKYVVTFAVGDSLHISSSRVLDLTVAK